MDINEITRLRAAEDVQQHQQRADHAECEQRPGQTDRPGAATNERNPERDRAKDYGQHHDVAAIAPRLPGVGAYRQIGLLCVLGGELCAHRDLAQVNFVPGHQRDHEEGDGADDCQRRPE